MEPGRIAITYILCMCHAAPKLLLLFYILKLLLFYKLEGLRARAIAILSVGSLKFIGLLIVCMILEKMQLHL